MADLEEPLPQVIQSDRNQAELNPGFDRYLEARRTRTMVTRGREMGRTHATVLDATHGYACQYPVEPGVFAWAARAGGFVSRGHAEPGAATLGHTILTIDHFVADQTFMSQVL